MAKPGWLNDNTFRSYPLIHGREGSIPDCAVVDFGSTTLAGSGYIEGLHEIWLEWIRRLNRTIEFAFRCNAPGLEDQMLIFQRDIGDPEFVTSFTWAQLVLTEEQLEAACECGANWVCNSTFDELAPPATTTTTPDPGSSSSDGEIEPNCDKYPGSNVFGWEVSGGVDQFDGLLRFQVPPFSTESAEQYISAFFPGQHLKLFFDLVSHDGNTSSFVTVSLASPGSTDIIISQAVTKPGTYQLNVDMPAAGLIYVVVKVINTSPTAELTATLDNITLQACISNSSSYSVAGPPEECPSNSLWEGFLVTGDMSCLLEFLEDCTRAGARPGGEGDADILFLTDTTGSMGGYIATIKAVFGPLANAVTASLPSVDFRWSACSYKDFEDGGNYALGIQVDQIFTTDIAVVQSAINSWIASGGGDGPEQNLSALKIVAETWLSTLAGRPNSQKAIIWGGDVVGWESGAKGNPYPTLNATVAALTSLGIKVFAINSQPANQGIDGIGSPSGSRQASAICNATGGILSNSVSQNDAESIADLVAQHILTTASFPGSVTFSLLEGPGYVEPSRTKNLDASYIRSLAVANAPRTRATSPEGCREYCWGGDPEYCIICECVAGDIRFQEGYNLTIRIDIDTNAIVFDAELSAGEGTPCGEVPACPTELVLAGNTTLSGSDTCLEVIRSINGSGNRFFDIVGGQGVNITPVPNQHRIIIDVGLNDLALCPSLDADEPVECLPPSTDICICGPVDPEDFECPDGGDPPDPSTTTTTPDPACGGPCTWSWSRSPEETVGTWVKISGDCLGTCTCSQPSFDGDYHGQQVTTNCSNTIPPCMLVNPEFADYTILSGAGTIESLNGWDYTDTDPETGDKGDIILSPAGGFPLFRIANQGVVIRLLARSRGDSVLKQHLDVTPERVYRVRAYVSNPAGRAAWGVSVNPNIFDATTVLTPINSYIEPGVAPDSGQFEIIEIGVPVGVDRITIFFRADKFLSFDGRGIMDVAGICVEPV